MIGNFMLDTDTCSYIIKRVPAVLDRLVQVQVSRVCISVVTKAELLFGVYSAPHMPKSAALVGRLLSSVRVEALGPHTAEYYARIRADLKSKGLPIGANDLWIAAHALSLGMVLVTNNVRELKRVAGLQIENWTQPDLPA